MKKKKKKKWRKKELIPPPNVDLLWTVILFPPKTSKILKRTKIGAQNIEKIF